MTLLPTLVAGLAYFALGGLWFTPLFGKQWDRAVGFQRPDRWRPSLPYYLVPLAGCLLVSLTVGFLLEKAGAATVPDAALVGLAIGAGCSLPITTVNALAPNMPRPALYAAVTGSYHLLGAVLCALIHAYWRG